MNSMNNRSWITVERAGEFVYWECPSPRKQKCVLDMIKKKNEIPGEITCHCGHSYKTIQLQDTRLLIEEDKQ